MQPPLQTLLSITKIQIKVTPQSPLLDSFHMLKASGTFAKDCCKEQAILLLQEQKCTFKNLRLLYLRVPYFSAWKSRGADLGVFHIWDIFMLLTPLSHQSGHKSGRKLCQAPWEEWGAHCLFAIQFTCACTGSLAHLSCTCMMRFQGHLWHTASGHADLPGK